MIPAVKVLRRSLVMGSIIIAVAFVVLLLWGGSARADGTVSCPTGYKHGAHTAPAATFHKSPARCVAVPQNHAVNLGVRSSSSGSCSDDSYSTEQACDTASETWTVTTVNASGIHEYNSLVRTAIPVILVITILWAGLMITRRVIRSFRGA